jgi:tRNA-splicing ligase RtcB
VGYDINCGMRLLTTPLRKEEVDVKQLAQSIHRDIPLGEGKKNIRLSSDDFAALLEGGVRALFEVTHGGHRVWEFWDDDEERPSLDKIEAKGSMEGNPAAVSKRAAERGMSQLGTLGGGNHFIEIQEVESIYDKDIAKRFNIFEGQVVVMIHSGSRGLGHQVGDEYMKLARSWDDSHGGGQPNNNLCFLPIDSKEGQNYISAMHSAANFAFANRHLMAALVKHNLRHCYGDIPVTLVYDVAHNIAKFERHSGKNLLVHRKGATRAFDADRMKDTVFAGLGQPVLIPGSMGTASYLLIGIPGGERSLFSVNHGAGRMMSRTQAAGKRGGRRRQGKKKREAAISDEQFRRSMEGIHLICEDRGSIKEEAPAAYKDIDVVIQTVTGADLAKAVARMVPLAVLKG